MTTREVPKEIAGRYLVERELGHGATAVVYLALDRRHGRHVAVKVLRRELSLSLAAERFMLEVQLTAQLQHPHIMAVLDSGEVDGLLYFVAPYLDGESLRDRLVREPQLAVDDALQIARELADALQYAHDRGIIHRDLKPENVLFSGDHACLADFGIAYALRRAAGERITASGISVGTPAYMSPEQASGERELDARSDLYSLACLVYEMLAGVQPFTGPSAESVIAQRFAVPPRPLRAFRAGVPEQVEEAIFRALAVAPADRMASVADFAAELGVPLRVSGGSSGHSARFLHRPHDPRRWRRPLKVALAAATVAAGAALFAFMDPLALSPAASVERGTAALRRGDGDEAGRWLTRAAARAPDDPAVQLWLAQRALLFPDSATGDWRVPLRVAASRATALSPADRERAAALAALAEGRYPAACGAMRAMAAADARDATATLNLATCLERDSAVVADASSPSGWRFRSSYHETVQAYLRALDQLEGAAPVKPAVYQRLIGLLRVEWGRYRAGFAEGDRGQRFAGFPALARAPLGDTLLLVPYRLTELMSGRPEREVPSTAEALEHSAGIARAAAERWTRELPDDAAAHATFARLLELRGELLSTRPDGASALSEARRARHLLLGTPRELQLIVHEVRLLLKQGEYRAAAELSDSALVRFPHTEGRSRWALAALAALRGRPHQTAELLGGVAHDTEYLLPDGRPYRPRAELAATALRLLSYCAVGAPADSIHQIQARLERQLASYVPEQSRDSVRIALMSRPLTLAAPVLGPAAVEPVRDAAIPMVRAQLALAARDTASATRMLDSIQSERSAYVPGAVQMDQAYLEAWLRAAVGDSAGALRQLGAVLDVLPTAGTALLDDVLRAGALPRAMLLRASLAAQAGDMAAAKHWNAAAAALGNRDDGGTPQ